MALGGNNNGWWDSFVNWLNEPALGMPVVTQGDIDRDRAARPEFYENMDRVGTAITLFTPGQSILSFFRSKGVATAVEEGGVTIIGEGMARVEAAAAEIPGAKILNDMPEFMGEPWQVTSQMMQYNRQWILNELRSGRTILDIGNDATRAAPSIFYQMEQNMIKNYKILNPH